MGRALIRLATFTGFFFLGSAAGAQQTLTHTLWAWDPGSEFAPLAATLERPIQGEIVETRINFTLHDVPPDFAGTPLDDGRPTNAGAATLHAGRMPALRQSGAMPPRRTARSRAA